MTTHDHCNSSKPWNAERRIRELEQTADEIRDEHRCAEKFVALVHKYTDYSEISDSMMNDIIKVRAGNHSELQRRRADGNGLYKG